MRHIEFNVAQNRLNLLGRSAVCHLSIDAMSLCTDPRPLQGRENLNQVHAIRPGDTPDLKLQNACQELCGDFPDLLKPELRCKLEKCAFVQPSVEYLRHVLSRQGIAKGPKVDAVLKMPAPTDVPSLRSFLRSIQFCTENLSPTWQHAHSHLI